MSQVSVPMPEMDSARSRPRHRGLQLAVSFVVLAALAIASVAIPGAGIVGLTAAMIGLLVFYLRTRHQGHPIEKFEIILAVGILHIMYFGGGAIYILYSPLPLMDLSLRPYLLPALGLATIALVAMLSGYQLMFARTHPSPLAALTRVHPFIGLLAGTVGTLGLAVGQVQTRLISSGAGISPGISALQQLGVFFFFGWFLVWYERASGRARRPAHVAAFAVLMVEAAFVIYTTVGTKTLAMAVMAFPCMAIYEARRRLPLKSMLAVVLVSVFVVFPIFNTYRIQSRDLDRNSRLATTFEKVASWNSEAYLDSSVFALIKRMAVVSSVAAVIADTGRSVPYAKGKTLFLAPIGLLIPRFLWPEKPDISIGREFARTFRLVGATDYETLVAPSLVGEFYWNFGVPCVLLGMFLIGAGYRWYYERYGRGAGYEPVRKAIYAAMFLTALSIEGNFSMFFTGLAKALAILVGFVVVMRYLGWIQEEPA